MGGCEYARAWGCSCGWVSRALLCCISNHASWTAGYVMSVHRQATLRPKAVRFRWSDQARVSQEGVYLVEFLVWGGVA